jgi:hypothetical protein
MNKMIQFEQSSRKTLFLKNEMRFFVLIQIFKVSQVLNTQKLYAFYPKK